MKAGKNKLLIDLEAETLIYWTLKSVFSASSTNWVGIIGQPKDKNLLLNSAKDLHIKFIGLMVVKPDNSQFLMV